MIGEEVEDEQDEAMGEEEDDEEMQAATMVKFPPLIMLDTMTKQSNISSHPFQRFRNLHFAICSN